MLLWKRISGFKTVWHGGCSHFQLLLSVPLLRVCHQVWTALRYGAHWEVFVVYQGDVPDSCEGMGMRAAIWKLSTQESLVISTCSTVALPFVGSEIPVDAFPFPLFKPFNE